VLDRQFLIAREDPQEGLVAGVGVLEEFLDDTAAADGRLETVTTHQEELLEVGVGDQPIAGFPVDVIEVAVLDFLAAPEDEGADEEEVLEGPFSSGSRPVEVSLSI
jgi:hypothetical protein